MIAASYLVASSASPTPSVRHTDAGGSSWSIVVPTWIGALATFGLFAGAIITAVFAVKAFSKQSEEVGLLQQQLNDQQKLSSRQVDVLELQAKELQDSLDERRRGAALRRRAQAARVFMEVERYRDVIPSRGRSGELLVWKINARVHNKSEQPIYEVTLTWRNGSAAVGEPGSLGTVMPGQMKNLMELAPEVDDPKQLSAIAVFRDAAEQYWRRDPDGTLDEVHQDET